MPLAVSTGIVAGRVEILRAPGRLRWTVENYSKQRFFRGVFCTTSFFSGELLRGRNGHAVTLVVTWDALRWCCVDGSGLYQEPSAYVRACQA